MSDHTVTRNDTYQKFYRYLIKTQLGLSFFCDLKGKNDIDILDWRPTSCNIPKSTVINSVGHDNTTRFRLMICCAHSSNFLFLLMSWYAQTHINSTIAVLVTICIHKYICDLNVQIAMSLKTAEYFSLVGILVLKVIPKFYWNNSDRERNISKSLIN